MNVSLIETIRLAVIEKWFGSNYPLGKHKKFVWIRLVEFKNLFTFSNSNTVLKSEPLEISDGDYGHEDDEFNPMEVDFPESSGT